MEDEEGLKILIHYLSGKDREGTEGLGKHTGHRKKQTN